MIKTLSLCPVCYKEIVAEIEYSSTEVWMHKTCDIHGDFRYLIENDVEFYQKYIIKKKVMMPDSPATIIYVTDRCNMNCKFCYHKKDNNSKDPSKEYVVLCSSMSNTQMVVLMGAEPTIREDLPEIISDIKKIGKGVGIYTNGLKLTNEGYVKSLEQAGLNAICFSLHHPDYAGIEIYQKKRQAIENIKKTGIFLEHVSFTLTDRYQLSDVIEIVLELGNKAGHYRIRTPYATGVSPEDVRPINMHMSDLFKAVQQEAIKRGLYFGVQEDFDGNVYRMMVFFGEQRIRLINCPTVYTVDLMQLMPTLPHGRFINGFTSNVVHQFILTDGINKGWFAGHRLAD